MDIKILGTGCAKCTKLHDEAQAVAEEMGLDYTLEKVSEIKDIMAYGVMVTPALVVDGKVVAVGKVPSRDEIRQSLS
jgi:small redox-active disulfide protein 2